jgi:aminoglycoside phosphotransferase (APT) family kinase protein
MDPDELRARLEKRLGGRIDELRRLSGGASGETWSFTSIGDDDVAHRLILRRETRQLVGPRPPEAAIFAAAARAGVPVPTVVVDGAEDDTLGAPYLIVEHVDGETIPRKILRDAAYASALPKMAAQCGEILARIHRIPIEEVPGLEQPDELTRYRELLDMFDQPHPAFELAFRWLDERRPQPTGVAVVHGDFRNGNLIVGPEGVRAVLDWELTHLGDPMEDLGWLCVKAWRFGSPRHVGGFGEQQDLFAAYARESGQAVGADVVRWWEVLGTLKWGIMCIAQAFSHLSGAARSVELATIGRRVCENEWDLLELMQ